jgi:hypothetical protein
MSQTGIQTSNLLSRGKIKIAFSKTRHHIITPITIHFTPSTIPNRYTMPSKKQQSDDCVNKSEQQRALFQKARDHLDPGPFFRFVTYFYAERKIAVFLLIHAICTLVIWGKLQYLALHVLSQTNI